MKNKIREFRKQKNITQDELAKNIGVTRQTINAIENEKYNPTLLLAIKLAKYLKVSVEELFCFEDD